MYVYLQGKQGNNVIMADVIMTGLIVCMAVQLLYACRGKDYDCTNLHKSYQDMEDIFVRPFTLAAGFTLRMN